MLIIKAIPTFTSDNAYEPLKKAMLPEKKEAVPGEIGHTLIQKQFFEMLPADFTKQDAVKQAEVLGINIKTIDYWLTKFVNSGDLQRIMNGKYQKANALIA